jgi:hypothetical protein
MFEALFGTEMPLALRFFIAFLVVLALIGGAAYLVRRFGASALNAAAGARGRQPRLAVIDHAAVDGRRRLVLIRRDNVEHLIMIGGPSDVVIEPNIVRAIPAAPPREAPPVRVADTLPRPVPLADGGAWPLQPEPAPRQPRVAPPPPTPPPAPPQAEAEIDWPDDVEPATRAVDAESDAMADDEPHPLPEREPRIVPEREPRLAPEREPRITAEREPRVAVARSRVASEGGSRGQSSERLAGLAADLSRSFTDPDAAPPPPRRSVEPRRAPPAPPAAVSESDDQNLAEMAQRLETALQRPRQGPSQGATQGVERQGATQGVEPSAAPAPRAAETTAPLRAEAAPAPAAPKPAAKPAPKPAAKPAFDSLEQEMASLLGRPSGKS